MLKRSIILSILLIVASITILSADTAPELPLTTARKLPAGLNVKQTRDFIWKLPAVIQSLSRVSDNGIPKEPTNVVLAYDAKNLYIACTCWESKMASTSAVVKKHDGPAWSDDSIEVMLDTLHNRKTYFHLVGTIGGAKYDERDRPGGDKLWDGPWSTEVIKEKDRWRILMIVPFKSLGMSEPELHSAWGFQVWRNELPHTEKSKWSPTPVTLHDPTQYGDLVFGSNDALIASIETDRLTAPMENNIQVTLSNPSKGNRDVESVLELNGKTINTMKHVCPIGVSQWDIKIDAAPPYSSKMEIVICDVPTNRIVMRTFLTTSIQDHRQALQECERLFKEATPKSSAAVKEKIKVGAFMEQVSYKAAHGPDNQKKWDNLGLSVAAARSRITRLQCLCADPEGYGYAIGTELPIRKIFRDKKFEGQLGGKAVIKACRNEFESTQVVVFPYNRPLKNVKVSVTSLKGLGASIPAASIDIRLVEYVETRTPSYVPSTTGWHPDPLMKLKTFSCQSGRIQPLWVTVHTPKGIPAGTYTGKLTVKPSDAPSRSIDLEVHVWDFELPKEMHMKTAFAFGEGEVEAWYKKKTTDQMRKHWYAFLLDHHINPTNIYSHTSVPTLADVPFCVEHGMTSFNLSNTVNMDDKALDDYITMLKPYETLLKEHGWWDKAYIYGFDEVSPQNYPKLQEAYSQVKQAFPDLKRMCTVIPNKDLKGYVDIWVPITANFNEKDAIEYTKAGDQVWWYVCCSPLHPYANFFIDYPAIEPRLLFWMNWKYRVPGFLYYDINMWWTNMAVDGLPTYLSPHQDAEVRKAIKAGKRWPEVPWNTFTWGSYNGDGHLIYPGPDGNPVSSIRLECIRDGIDDYEYMYILNELVDRAEKNGTQVDPKTLSRAKELLSVRPELVKSLTEYTNDPEAVMSTREEIAQTIESLQVALK